MSEQLHSNFAAETPYELQDVKSNSPEHEPKTREKLKVTLLNTSFSEAFDHPESLDELLKTEPGEAAIFGFSEVD